MTQMKRIKNNLENILNIKLPQLSALDDTELINRLHDFYKNAASLL